VEPVKILPVTPVTCGAHEDSSNDSRSLWSPFPISGDKQGRAKAARATAARGRTRCHFY